MIKLVPIDAIYASEYNPRRNDEKRLAITRLSLQKLGFLLPVYADESGEILSGHQRHLVARDMGFKQIPVQYMRTQDLRERKAVNILFNRATNDLSKTDNVPLIKKRLYSMDVQKMADALPDISPESKEAFPCVYSAKYLDVTTLAQKNHRKFDVHTAALSKALEKKIKTPMPVVVDDEMNIINGVGRLQAAAEAHRKVVQCVVIEKQKAEFAAAMLNLLSMDFDIGEEYADMLRYNSFMRQRNTRETDERGRYALGDGFFKGLFPNNTGRDFFELESPWREQWIEKYGDKIVDFGAGKLANTNTLRRAGIYVSAFEPYFVSSHDSIHKATSLEITEKFLSEVESGVQYTSVFISSVFNSVPFMADRIKIAVIAAALCYPAGQVICWCQSTTGAQFSQAKRKSLNGASMLTFPLDYEPNIMLGDLTKTPKVQKGHTGAELIDIFKHGFRRIKRIDEISNFWYLEAEKPFLDTDALQEALEFEFELPYPDGTRMGMSQRAKQAFEKRLGIKFKERSGQQ